MNKQAVPVWKRFMALVAILAMVIALSPAVPVALADEDEDQIEIELKLGSPNAKGKGGNFKLPGAPFVAKGHFMAPLAAIANQLDCKVQYNSANKTITISHNQSSITLTLGKVACTVNGKAATLPVAPVAKRGTTFVPIKFILQNLFGEVDCSYKWGRLKIKAKHHHRHREGWDSDDVDDQIKFEPMPGVGLTEKAVSTPCVLPITRADLTNAGTLPQDARLLAVIRGWCSSTGYSIETRGLVVKDGKLTVYVDLKNPPVDSVQATVMTYVYQVIRLQENIPQYNSWEMRTGDNQLIASSAGTAPSASISFEKPDGLHVRQEIRELETSSPTLVIGTAASLLQNSTMPGNTPVLAAVWGMRSSSGYSIDVRKLELKAGVLVATVRLTTPTGYILPALTWVDQVLKLPESMPAISGWEMRDEAGALISSKSLTPKVPFTVADSPDLEWVNRDTPGIESKLVTVDKQQRLLVVVKRGVCPTSGYGIQLTGLRIDGFGRVTADVTLTTPLPESTNLQVQTRPLVAVYLDPVFAGHAFTMLDLTQPDSSWTNPVIVDAALRTGIDRTQRRVLTGYGRDLLASPGDLEDDFLVVVFRGQCVSGGYSIAVKEFVRVGDLVKVVVEEKNPAPGAVVSWGITFPYQIVKAPAGSEKLAFELYTGKPEVAEFDLVSGALKPGVDVTERGAVWIQGKNLFTLTTSTVADEWFLLVKRGPCPSTGYGLEVERVELVNQTLRVLVKETNPTPGSTQAWVITHPYLILRLADETKNIPVELVTAK